jgi:hypothetical protein
MLRFQPPIGFIVKTKQLGDAYHFVGNDFNKMVGIALLIALVRRTLNQSTFMPPRQDIPNGYDQACSKTAAENFFVPNKRV